MLVTLVEAWERKHYPLDLPDPVEAIKYHMDQNGLQPRDLIPFIGSRNRVHEVLNRKALADAQNDLAIARGARHSRRIADQEPRRLTPPANGPPSAVFSSGGRFSLR